MPLLPALIAALVVGAGYYLLLRGPQSGTGGPASGDPNKPDLKIDTNPAAPGGGGATLTTKTTNIDSLDEQRDANVNKVAAAGGAVGSIFGPIGTAAGTFAGKVIGSLAIKPPPSLLTYDWSGYGMPWIPSPYSQASGVLFVLPNPDESGAISAQFSSEYLLAALAGGDAESLKSFVDANAFIWTPGDDLPVTALLLESLPHLADWRLPSFTPGAPESGFGFWTRLAGTATSESESWAMVKRLRYYWHGLNTESGILGMIGRGPTYPLATTFLSGYLYDLQYLDQSAETRTAILDHYRGVLGLGAFVTKPAVLAASLSPARARFAPFMRKYPRGRGLPGAWRITSRQGNGAFTFETWLPGSIQSERINVTSQQFLSLYNSHAAVESALRAGNIAWKPKGLPSGVEAIWLGMRPELATLRISKQYN